MTSENRRTPRKKLKHFLTVLDAHTQQPLGRMVDISQVGMMLIGGTPLLVNHEYLLDIPLAPDGSASLRLQASCQWSRSGTTNTSHHGSGFRFSPLSAEQRQQLNALILAENPG